MGSNKFAKWAILPAILSMVVAMMLSLSYETVLEYIGYTLIITSIGLSIKGIVDYVKDKSIEGLGFTIASILISLWAFVSINQTYYYFL